MLRSRRELAGLVARVKAALANKTAPHYRRGNLAAADGLRGAAKTARRADLDSSARIRVAGTDLVIDRRAHQAIRGTRLFNLGANELTALKHLSAHQGTLVPRAQLIKAVWGQSGTTTQNYWNLLNRLQRKINAAGEPPLIRIVNESGRRGGPGFRDQGVILSAPGAAIKNAETRMLRSGDIRVNLDEYQAFRHDRRMKLNPGEVRMLERFMHNPGRMVSRDQLRHLGGRPGGEPATDGSLNVKINALRRELGDSGTIELVRDEGYVFWPAKR